MEEKKESPQSSLTDIVTSAAFILVLLLLAVIGVSAYSRISGRDDKESVRELVIHITPLKAKNVDFEWQVDPPSDEPIVEPTDSKTQANSQWMYSVQRVDAGSWTVLVKPYVRLPYGNAIVESAQEIVSKLSNSTAGRIERFAIDYSDALMTVGYANGYRATTSNANLLGIANRAYGTANRNDLGEKGAFDYAEFTIAIRGGENRSDQLQSVERRGHLRVEYQLIQLECEILDNWATWDRNTSEAWAKLDERVATANRFWARGNRDPYGVYDNLAYNAFRLELVRARLLKEYFNEEYITLLPPELCRYCASLGSRFHEPVGLLTSVELVQLFKVDAVVELKLDAISGMADKQTVVMTKTIGSTNNGRTLPVAIVTLGEATAPPTIDPLWKD
ncbi:hypothetical protein LOC67_09160 [Stieleria sp. JC731]|uniref:hypothetical protein n=1 Tax=Pirellulaceae TaxID=2691357 RepID=UPI001E2A7739|nr:hypothetical protein [Stieleria sp. JC731]MCC9600731.1 hypothetical protein [Stieleria sp. JC731]